MLDTSAMCYSEPVELLSASMSNALGDESSTQAGEILSEQVMSLIKESPRLETGECQVILLLRNKY